MKLVMLHHHLNSGGVTRVIAAHLQSLAAVAADEAIEKVGLLYDGQAGGWPSGLDESEARLGVERIVVPQVGYDTRPIAQPQTLARTLEEALSSNGFPPDETILHVHNHSLGKNASLPAALAELARSGYRLLLQIHDFAEDFRPKNYRHLREAWDDDDFAGRLYPQAAHIWYGTLNQRDAAVLTRCGIPQERLVSLPNPVPPLPTLPDRDDARRRIAGKLSFEASADYVLYPVRGIRRKNVGEFLLHAAVARQTASRTQFAMTLPPVTAHEVVHYEHWKSFARKMELPLALDAGLREGLEYVDHLAAADAIATTSVAEGFGMVFLEAWLTGSPLYGRDLPEITADFTAAGLDLSALYGSIEIPVDWVGRDAYAAAFRQSYRSVCEAYDRASPSESEFDRAIAAHLSAGTVDFGDLNEDLQTKVLERVSTSAQEAGQLWEANPGLRPPTREERPEIETNAEAVRDTFSLSSIGHRLLTTYNELARETPALEVTSLETAESLVDAFLDPGRFRLIRGAL